MPGIGKCRSFDGEALDVLFLKTNLVKFNYRMPRHPPYIFLLWVAECRGLITRKLRSAT